jgi:hypothetical protein
VLLERLNHWVLTTLQQFNSSILSGPERPEALADEFSRLRVGPDGIGFVDYFTRLVRVTGTGHPPRDCYASLVRWNAPTAEVRLGGQRLAVLPGCFDDARIRTCTADPGEAAFFELLKKSEALELAANRILEPLSEGVVDILSPEAERRARMATILLMVLARLNHDFATRAAERGGMRPDHFMDVFRQFAVHWEIGDVPPSGAQDPEFLRRDLLLGIAFPRYDLHLRRNFPALLETERMILRCHAMAGVWYRLLAANAKIGAVHLLLAEKYLFKPQRARDGAGIGDRPLVSNRTGTTGMDESLLVRLARARHRHPLRRLEQLRAPVEPDPASASDPATVVRFVRPRE